MTKEPQEETYQTLENKALDTILKEADKEYDKIWSELGYKKSIPEFYHSQISKAYEAGQEEGRKNLLDECPDTQFLIGKAIAEERERIRKFAEEYMEETTKYYGTDKHGIDKDDLLQELQNK